MLPHSNPIVFEYLFNRDSSSTRIFDLEFQV